MMERSGLSRNKAFGRNGVPRLTGDSGLSIALGNHYLDRLTCTLETAPGGLNPVFSPHSFRSLRSFALVLSVCLALLAGAGNALAATPDLLVASQGSSQILRYNGTTGTYIGVFASNPAMDGPESISYGPDGSLYVASGFSNNVTKFSSINGAYMGQFVPAGTAGLSNPQSLTFGPDGNLYVLTHSTAASEAIWKFNGTTGAFISKFGTGGGNGDTDGLTFGPDNNLYQGRRTTDNILKFDGTTGGSLGVFATDPTNLSVASNLAFGPDGNLYVSNVSPGGVARYNGTTGAFIDFFIPSGDATWGLKWGSDNKLYVGFTGSNEIKRYNSAGTFLDQFTTSGTPLNGPFSFAFAPEPGSISLLVIGMGAAVLRRRARR